ncbi:hypothetical protein QNN00_24195 [Bacillus velezensis]|nr:hypothetical protein [Bacillus velezensis]
MQTGRHEEDGILSLNTDYEYEWRPQEAVQSAGQARERKTQLDAIFEQARLELEEAERKHAVTAENILDPAVKKEKEAALQSYKQTADTEGNEWQAHVQHLENSAPNKKALSRCGHSVHCDFRYVKGMVARRPFTGALRCICCPACKTAAVRKRRGRTQEKEAGDL